jgi:FKBP-type peptidyl-prolyl cis-trans isomerase
MRSIQASAVTAAFILTLENGASALSLPDRREVMQQLWTTASASALVGGGMVLSTPPSSAWAADTESTTEGESMFAPKFVQEYADFTKTSEGWSFRDVSVGNGASPNMGDRVVYEWSGYTIGYFGRPFEAKGGPQGGAFDKRDVDFSRTVLGSGEVVKGLECAMRDMKVGGVRQVIVPYGALSYPADDASHDRVGPKPTTFSGQRALNFVLDNPRVDRTLLFNVKLIRVDKPDGKGGFQRGDRV